MLAVSGVVVAPDTVVSVLPVDTRTRITGAAGRHAAVQIETREVAELPQNFAYRFGQEGTVATVAGVQDDLPADERREACTLAGNYGGAGAIGLSETSTVSPMPSVGVTSTTSGNPAIARARRP